MNAYRTITSIVVFVALFLGIAGCTTTAVPPPEVAEQPPTTAPEPSPGELAMADPEVVPLPSATPQPTNTSIPTAEPTNTTAPTSEPTNTAVATLPPTDTPEPTLEPAKTPAREASALSRGSASPETSRRTATTPALETAGSSLVTPEAAAAPLLSHLVTSADLAALSEDLAIYNWQLDTETGWESRACRYFYGESWSINLNESINCLFPKPADFPFQQAVATMFDWDILGPSAIPLEPNNQYDQEIALFADRYDNGQAVYDLFVEGGEIMYWASVSIGVPVGETAETLYQKYGALIEAFLYGIVQTNMARAGES